MKLSPTQLTLRHLRADGYLVAVVEHWNPHAGIRQDLFGWIDVIALKDGETLAVQTTTATNVSARIRKIAESDTVAAVRAAGWTIRCHGWAKVRGRWQLTRDVDCS